MLIVVSWALKDAGVDHDIRTIWTVELADRGYSGGVAVGGRRDCWSGSACRSADQLKTEANIGSCTRGSMF